MRKNIDFKERVVWDYRKKIITDKDNPILAFKASRDRYSPAQKEFAGRPYLGSNASEDALTWNVFRTLYKTKKLGCILNELKLGRIRSLALWGLTPDIKHWNKKFQYDIGNAIRTYDGIYAGQTTEPDVAILGSSGILIIECKLGYPYKALTHIWEGSMESINKRLPIYTSIIQQFHEYHNEAAQKYYQLIRMAFYAVILGRKYGLPPYLASLTSMSNWGLGKPSPALTWDEFSVITKNILPELRLNNFFWQDLVKMPCVIKTDTLYRYLKYHPSLK